MDEEYPSNSKLVKRNTTGAPDPTPQKPRVQRVTTGEVRRKPKGLLRKAKEAFVGDDTKGVSEYVVVDIVIPGIKRMFEESITQGISRKLWGSAMPMRPGQPMMRQAPWVNYQQPTMMPPAGMPPTGALNKQVRANHRFDQIVFGARVDAESVLHQLMQLVADYGIASVRDFFDSMGEESEYTDESFGWRRLDGAHVRPASGGGYQIILPQPERLN